MLQHKPISEEIVEEIVHQIRSGKLLVGMKLPPERVFAQQLGVSRTSLREALRTLKRMGCVRSAAGDGNYINTISPEHIAVPFAVMLSQDKVLAADIIKVRQYLEVHMAWMAAAFATKDQIGRIHDAIIDMQSQIEQGGNGIKGDSLFHLEIAKASQNRAFSIIQEMLAELLDESRQATLDIPGQPQKSVQDHLKIFAAIQSGDRTAAKEAMEEHLTKAHQNLVDADTLIRERA